VGQGLAFIHDALRVEKELSHPLVALFGGAKQLAQLMNFLTEIGYGHGGELDDFLLGRCWLYVPLGFSPAYSAFIAAAKTAG
jgi:hypothetical protein